MPLRSVDEHGTIIEASACTDQEWTQLRERVRKERQLRMPCCPARAVPKTSKLGTRFFAHKAKGTCTWKPETEAHLQLKKLALNAARKTGWEAQTEVAGCTPDNEKWTADVLAWKGEEKVAVEIQWSGQTNEETWRRQRRYQRSGIKGIWLLRQPGFPISADLPAACIGGSIDEGLRILIPKWEGGTAHQRKEDWHWMQFLEPEQFMTAVFEKRFLFGIGHTNKITFSIQTGVLECWKCGTPTRIVTALEGQLGPHEIRVTLDFVDGTPDLAERVESATGHRKDIGTIRERYSKTIGGSYTSNGCARCDSLIGRHFEHEAYYCEEEIVGTIEWELDCHWMSMLGQETQRWGVW